MGAEAITPVLSKIIPAAIQGAGTGMEVAGANQAGDAAMLAAQRVAAEKGFEADQATQNAGQAVAASQRGALEQQRQSTIAQSRMLAVAAASGGGARDPTIVNLIARNAGEGAYRSGLALYQGEEQSRQLLMQASAKRFEGQVALEGGQQRQQAYRTAATSSLIKGAGSLFAKYGVPALSKDGKDDTQFPAPVESRTPDYIPANIDWGV